MSADRPRARKRSIVPTIAKYMTPAPHSIGVEQTLARAGEVMREHKVRHLAIVHDGSPVGVLTDRQVRFLEGLEEVDPKLVPVAATVAQPLYAVPCDAPLDEVVAEMGGRKCDSAVVMQNDKVVGVLTTVDVCRAFADLLSRAAKAPRRRGSVALRPWPAG